MDKQFSEEKYTREDLIDMLNAFMNKSARLEKKIQRLGNFTQHKERCARNKGPVSCDCGLDQLLGRE